MGQPAARSSGIGGTDAAVRRHPRLVRDDGAGPAQEHNLFGVDVAGVGGEEPGPKKVVPVKVRRRTKAVVHDHELVLCAALVQVDRVAEVVRLGELAHGPQQFG